MPLWRYFLRWFAIPLSSLSILCTSAAYGQDGTPGEFVPTDLYVLALARLKQNVLVIYAQTNDFRILSGDDAPALQVGNLKWFDAYIGVDFRVC